MKKLNSGDTLIWPNGKRVTVRNVREGANGEMFCDFHEISCDWTVHQLSVMGLFDDVLTQQWRDANRYRNSVVSGQTDEFKSFDMADIAIGLLNQMVEDGFIEAGTAHNWVEVSDEPVNDYPSKICIRKLHGYSFDIDTEYQYYQRVFFTDTGGEFAVIDKRGEWHYFDREDFERCFTIKQPNQ